MAQTFNRDTLRSEYEDAYFRLIMADYARAEGEILIRENEVLKNNPANQITPAEIKEYQQKINKTFRKRIAMSTLKNVSRAFNKVAIIIVLIFTAFTVTAMSVQAVRVNVLNFLIGFEKEYASISIGNSDSGGIIGDNLYITWRDAYVPLYIPDGYTIYRVTSEKDYKSIDYIDAEGHRLAYYEYSDANVINLDTENAERVETTFVQGHDALLIEKNGKMTIAWLGDGRLFMIMGQVTEDEMFKIAEGVKFVN